MELQMGFTMPVVTREEYRMLEKMFLRNDGRQEPIRMTGEAFLILFQEVRRQVALQGLQSNQDNVTAYINDPWKSGSDEQKQKKHMDGIGFLWGFFSNNSSDEISCRLQRRCEVIKDSARDLQPEKTLKKDSACMNEKEFEVDEQMERKELDGIRFLWSFFSKDLPSQVSRRMQKRYEQLKDPAKQQTSLDTFNEQLRERLFELGGRFDEDAWSMSSVCSSISFMTASETSSIEPNSDSTIGNEEISVPILGCRGTQEENYLDTPSSSESSSICEHHDASSQLIESAFGGKHLFFSTQFINEIADTPAEKSLNSSFSSGTSWEVL